MKRNILPRPTAGELAILQALWWLGPATVRQVHDVLIRAKPVGYTTILKLMQIMTEKGLLLRDENRRTHIYRPASDEEKTQRQLVGELLDRAFGGSAKKLILQALSSTKATAEDLAEIRKLIEKMEGEK